MKSAELPLNETQRLHKLRELDIMDTLEEQAYDDLTLLAAEICNTPIALVSLLDENRQWFKSHHGLDARETPRNVAFCAHAILQDDLFVIEDSDKDERFHDNPLVTGQPHVKFYAGAPLIMDDGSHIGTLCVIDHHARGLTENQKKALTALARQVVSQLDLRLTVRELKELDHAKDEFLSMVSHELRTPLTSIKGSLSLLTHVSGSLDEQSCNMLDIARRNSEQLLTIVNDILDLAKMEAGKLEMDYHLIDLVELLQQTLQMNMAYIKQCGCDASLVLPNGTDVSEQGIWVKVDPQRISQVVSNLLSNAAKFSSKGGQIELLVAIENSSVKVSVIDHGMGIPPEQQDLLFSKFRQIGKPSNQKLPGTGLGLNICKHIVEAHKGKIGFHSVPSEKTEFYFTLELAKE